MGFSNDVLELNKIAGFMTGENDLWITNRFERLHLMNLLSIQRRLLAIEGEVNDHILYEKCLCGGELHPKPARKSKAIFKDLTTTTKAYHDAVSSLAMLKASGTPAPHVLQALRDGAPEAADFFTTRDIAPDLRYETQRQLAVATEPKNWIHRYIARHRRLARLFEEKQNIRNVNYLKFSEDRVKKAEFLVVAVSLCVVQMLPVLALTLVSSKGVRLAVIIVLIALVSVLNALFANTVRATNFGAIAAYSAIVVVFISQST
ncbi:hypothetical protein ACN47E_002644 [Coniothyrium glycines]